MKPIAYVSDEMYVALLDVVAEFESLSTGEVAVLRSSPRGAFYADIPAGKYKVTLAKAGYGSKSVTVELGTGKPYQFRLLSDSLIGYMWPKAARSGEKSEYRVHAVEQYQMTLWRYGLKKEYVQMVGWMDEHGPRANMQITPDGDYTPTGVNWNKEGYGAPSHTQFVTAPEKSGLYYLWLRTPTGKTFSFPWIVAPVAPKAKIAVLASSNAWNAYNNFGGRSNYINADHLPETPVVNARLDLERYQHPTSFGTWKPFDHEFTPLSFERPELNNHIFDNPPWGDSSITDMVQGRVQCGQAPGEWRLLGWLEREGFDYDYYSEGQLHDGTLPLDSYKIVMVSIHPEYWTRQMYLRMKAWVFERGGRLMYLAGNGLNCEVVFLEDGSMKCLSHLNSVNGDLGGVDENDPTIVWESRLHRTLESEANLTGMATTERGLMTAAPYKVIDASHWAFAGTGAKAGDLFGEKTLHERVPGGASGHETDKITASSPKNLEHLAEGINPNNGGGDVIVHEPGHGGAVFSVGSMTWVPALFVDPVISKITRNVIEKFLS